MSTPFDPTSADTVELIPADMLVKLGRLGLLMIEAQRRVRPAQIPSKAEAHFLKLCRECARCAREHVGAHELVALARQGQLVRAELTRDRGRPVTAEFQTAVIAQRRWTTAAEKALTRQQGSLPGMSGSEEGGGSA